MWTVISVKRYQKYPHGLGGQIHSQISKNISKIVLGKYHKNNIINHKVDFIFEIIKKTKRVITCIIYLHSYFVKCIYMDHLKKMSSKRLTLI